jgi:signal transduction histidine kinase
LKRISSRNLALLAAIIAVAVLLSLISSQFSEYTAMKIEDISVRDIHSNAQIQVHDLSNSLSNRMTDVTNNLKILSNLPTVQGKEFEKAKSAINVAKSATSELVDFYMWLDRDGRIVWISNLNQTQYETYRGQDLSYRLYFEIPRENHQAFYSSVTESNDEINRLYISYPVLHNAASSSTPEFEGVMVAGIRTDIAGKLLENQLSPNLQSQVTLLDNTGIVLYSKDQQYVGKNVFGVKFQPFLLSFDVSTLRSMNEGFKAALNGAAGFEDITIDGGKKATFAYEPVVIGGQRFGVLYILASHEQTADVAELVGQQRNMSILFMLAIGAAAAGILFIIFTWNRRLEDVVNARTSELKAANEQLKSYDRMQREFINIAAHELRTPITPIIAMMYLAKPKNDDGSSDVTLSRERYEIIDRNAKRLERLSKDILDVARIESGKFSLEREVFDINKKIKDMVDEIGKSVPDSQVIEIPPNPATERDHDAMLVNADSGKIFQVVSNLLKNAMKFTPQNGTITVSTERQDDNVVIKVKDDGRGIDPEVMPKLFQKFASSSEMGGTGLGLFISKSIVDAHGGRVWAENNADGKGATFAFTLPLAKT